MEAVRQVRREWEERFALPCRIQKEKENRDEYVSL